MNPTPTPTPASSRTNTPLTPLTDAIEARCRIDSISPLRRMRDHARSLETRLAEATEALRWAMKHKSKPTLINGQNEEYCAKYAEAEAILSRSPESKQP